MSLRARLALLLTTVIFIENVLFYRTYVKNVFMIIEKMIRIIFLIIYHITTNIFLINNKLLKQIFIKKENIIIDKKNYLKKI